MLAKTGILLSLVLLPVIAQGQQSGSVRVVFYNVENLFDTRNDSLTVDDDFTPRGRQCWTQERYVRKLLNLSKVLMAVGEGCPPAIIGLGEVENRMVLLDLIGKTGLADGKYGIVHADSPDPRGIDVALLYREDLFHVVRYCFFPVQLGKSEATRDILYCEGVLSGCDTIHFFVCHFPSMRGGEARSEWKRVKAATVVRQKVDSIQNVHQVAQVIIMGDMNGRADTRAQQVLKARNPEGGKIEVQELYNVGYHLFGKPYGSYRYKGEWQTLDHIIVSGSLFGESSGLQASQGMKVFDARFLMEEERGKFGERPRPTYRGPRYIGGYSDHLPVFIDLKNKCDVKRMNQE